MQINGMECQLPLAVAIVYRNYYSGIVKQEKMKIAVLAGDYIGPEVMAATLMVLEKIAQRFSLTFDLKEADVGGSAIDSSGSALPQKTVEICQNSEAILFGSIGGPKWESLPPDEQPERAALLPLRKQFKLFANVRPTTIFPMLIHASPLRIDRLSAAIDIVIIRELTGGIYFAEPKKQSETYAYDTLRYETFEIERIAHIAFQTARLRKKRVTSIDKANVLTSMVFWRNTVSEVAKQYPDIALTHMYVDNAAMQLILHPDQFDVMLCPNMFGDILSDEAAVLPGSLGMQPSASLGNAGSAEQGGDSQRFFGLYEPAGGSAPDIAGQNIANPIAQILSAALMFRFSFARNDIHDAIYHAVRTVLDKGYRTADIRKDSNDRTVSTTEMGNLIADAL